MTWCI